MTKYVPASASAELSAALFALSRPPAIRAQGEVTNSMCSWFYDTQGDRWILIDDQREVRVHELAELNGIADILQPFIDSQILPPDTNDALTAFVESKRGARLVVYDAFPQFFKDQAKTRQQMIDDGLLPSPTP